MIPEPAALQIWERMFDSDDFQLPETDYMIRIGEILPEKEARWVGLRIVRQIQSKGTNQRKK